MKRIDLFTSYEQEFRILKKHIVRKAQKGKTLQILEAGCGWHWPIDLDGIQYALTGLDIDKDALNLRKERENDLDHIILGDLTSVELPDNTYDVIYNSFVLEHIQGAHLVLNNFYKWLKPGGILILRFPDRDSAYGFFTRITPLWFHVFYKKYVEGISYAGKPGFGPYPTIYDPVVSRKEIRAFFNDKRLKILEEFGHGYYLGHGGVITLLKKMFTLSLNLVSCGGLAWKYNNLTYVIKK